MAQLRESSTAASAAAVARQNLTVNPNEVLAAAAGLQPTPTFNQDDRRYLLRVARRAIDSALRGVYPEIEVPAGPLGELRGVFTTLRIEGKLRGCVGQPFPIEPLVNAVAATAIGAATRDPRFPPLQLPELLASRIGISVLSPIFAISPDEIEIGRHGLLISLGVQRGLLLPEVPVHMSWDLGTFLAQTCQKSGLASDAWRNGATVEAFTTEAFSEEV